MDTRKQIRRKQPSEYVAVSLYLPRLVAQEMERRAEDEYGSNKSALATDALANFLSVPVPEYQTEVKHPTALVQG